MFTMMREVGLRKSLSREAPAFVVSLLIAEWFYKFHSFTLECVAFVVTWCAVSAAATCIVWLIQSHRPINSRGTPN